MLGLVVATVPSKPGAAIPSRRYGFMAVLNDSGIVGIADINLLRLC